MAAMFHSAGAVALLEDEDDDPEGGGEREQVQQHCLDREHDRAERARQQDQRQQQHERQHVGEAAEQGVQEVAVDRGDAGQRAVGPLEARVGAVDDRLDAGSGAVDRRRTPRRASSARDAISAGAVAPTTPGTVRSLAATCSGSPPCSTRTSSGFITPGLMPAAAS